MTDEKTEDLLLHYKFTDRGGARVYDAFSIDDRHQMKNRLFEIRIHEHQSVRPVINHPDSKVEGHGTG